jgi:hypothetical protein
MNIEEQLSLILQNALAQSIQNTINENLDNARKGDQWIQELTNQFRQQYPTNDDFRVFSKPSSEHRNEFLLNELLHDICVVRTATIPSAFWDKNLIYVAEGIWQIESEFQTDDSRETLKDFNKLVLGSAQNKLFIAPSGGRLEQWMMRHLCVVAARCTGNVFLALVPQPNQWNTGKLQIQLFKLEGQNWDDGKMIKINT